MKKEIKKLIEEYYDWSSSSGSCIFWSNCWFTKLKEIGFNVRIIESERPRAFHYYLLIDDYIFDPTYRQFFFNPEELPPIFFGKRKDFVRLLEENKGRYYNIFDYIGLYKLR